MPIFKRKKKNIYVIVAILAPQYCRLFMAIACYLEGRSKEKGTVSSWCPQKKFFLYPRNFHGICLVINNKLKIKFLLRIPLE